ncbi:hypothetical protein EVA_19121 [gut metagenome]|uniref:Uncharacterized protein n=1 Tax=gut metagenome TaxID=749906 RepID=J9FCZ3_9ZZZZ
MAESKKTVTVTLEVKEVVFDVQNKTHLTGVSRKAEGTKDYEAAANMQASEDDEHSYQIRRSISNAFGELKVELGEYLNESATTSTNKIIKEVDANGQLVLSFILPSNFNSAACDSLGAELHEYMVARAIADWFTITNKADAGDYVNIASAALERAKKAMYKRSRPKRPTYPLAQ